MTAKEANELHRLANRHGLASRVVRRPMSQSVVRGERRGVFGVSIEPGFDFFEREVGFEYLGAKAPKQGVFTLK